MPRPQITFRGIEHSDALENLVQEKADKLLLLYDKIERISVLIEEPHRRHNQGRHFHVLVTLHVPGDDLVSSRDTPKGEAEDPYFAVTHAFDAARRQLQEWLHRIRDAKRASPGS